MTEFTAHCAAQEIATGPGAPEMVHLLPLGKIVARDGRRFDLRDPEAVIAASMGKGVDLVIDYEHQSEERKVNGPAPAAGWIKSLELRPDGIWGHVEWTAQARELIASRAYRYLSPVFRFSASTGVVRRLTGAGLVHQPALELTALAREEPAMPNPSPDFSTRLAAALGLPEGAEASAIEDRFFALVEQMTALVTKGEAVAPNAERPDPAQYAPLATMRELLTERNTAVAALRESEVERRVTDAIAGGYITPGMKDWATALCRDKPDHFDAFLSSAMPAYAHFFKPIIAGKPSVTGAQQAASPEVQAICAQLDLDPKALG